MAAPRVMEVQCTRIIGVDPGTRYTGIGIIEQKSNSLRYLFSDTIVTADLENVEDKLERIFEQIGRIIGVYQPMKAGVERIFHSVNARSSLMLGHARGVALLAIKLGGVELAEFSPNEIKSAVVGVGRASKSQVNDMVKILLSIERNQIIREDEADALAAAICCANTMNFAAHLKT